MTIGYCFGIDKVVQNLFNVFPYQIILFWYYNFFEKNKGFYYAKGQKNFDYWWSRIHC